MSIFNLQGQQETAVRGRGPRRPTTLTETLSTAYDAPIGSLTGPKQIYNEFETFRNQLREATDGASALFNPMNIDGAQREKAEKRFFEEIDKLREQFPDIPPMSREIAIQNAAKERKAIVQRRAEAERGESGFISGAVAFAGGAAGAIADPLILSSMLLGAPAAAGIVRTALTEAGIGVGSEALVQVGVQVGRRKFGEEPSLTQAAEAILLAGAGGAAGAALIKGGIAAFRGTRSLVQKAKELPAEARTGDVAASEILLERLAEIEESNPFTTTQHGLGQHIGRLDAEINRLRGTTAVGRVLGADDPISVTLEPALPVAKGEQADQFLARVERENPELFNKNSGVEARLAANTRRLETVDAELNSGRLGAAIGEGAATRKIQNDLAAATDPRRIKRLGRKLEEAGVDRVKKGTAAKTRQTKLQKERTNLGREIENLESERKLLLERVNRKLQETEAAPTEFLTAFRVKQVMQDFPVTSVSRAAGRAADLGEAMTQRVDNSGPVPADASVARRTETANRAARTAPEQDPPSLEQAAEASEARLRATADETPDASFTILDEDGNVRTVTARQMVDEIDSDEKLIDEFGKCIEGII